ncbi:MAG TPA: hypothetical protein VF599_16600 [Pyrinomonadaceae bacterium]|jgi:hypothetical protein
MKKEIPPEEIYAPFVINKKPYCFWDIDMPDANRRFINQIDPNYFEYVARVNFAILKNEDLERIDEKTRQYAAVTMRIAYSQALEVLFSFLFASIQAPHCVIGWLLKYTNEDLFDVVKRFRDYEEILHNFPKEIRGWDSLVDIIFQGLDKTQEESISLKLEGFARLWEQFAQDFLDKSFTDEYNSIKHGLRVHMGGFHLMMGPPQEKLGEITPIEKMETVAYSKFGTTFFVSEKIEKTPNYIIHTQSRNWNPENYYHALILISVSIKNILVFLKMINGNKEMLEFILPNDEDFHRKPWLVGSGMSMGQKSNINVSKIPLLSKEDVLATYNKSDVEKS